MPEYVFVFIASGVFAFFGFANKKFEQLDGRMDALELKVAEHYVTKEDMKGNFDLLFQTLARLEDKIDARTATTNPNNK